MVSSGVFRNKFFHFICTVLLCVNVNAQDFELVENFTSSSQLNDVNGVAVADYDRDGDLDVFIVSIHRYEKGNNQTWSRLLRNDGSGNFTDATVGAGLFDEIEVLRSGWMGDRMSASWGDYNNDGFADLFLGNDGPDQLWKNNGDGTFTRATEEAGITGCSDCYSSNGVWWDYNNDGYLDLYVSDWLKRNRFYHNNGDGTFQDLSIPSGLEDHSKTWASLPIDVNQDGLIDLYNVNDFGANYLFVNQGDGSFAELTEEYDLQNRGDGMGVDVGDLNNDGKFEIYITNIYDHLPNPLFFQQEDGTFRDLAASFGVENTGWGWGTRFFDFDHDMDEDLYVVNGMNLSAGRGDRNFFFENQDGMFQNIAPQLGMDDETIGRGLEVFDIDGDGDLDAMLGNREAPMALYKNLLIENSDDAKNWIKIELRGVESNYYGVGSTIEVNCGGIYRFRHYSGVNLMGQSLKPIHIGLDKHDYVHEIGVTWPNGEKEFFIGGEANQTLLLTEGSGRTSPEFVLSIVEDDPSIYPNPARDVITLNLPKRVNPEIKIFNINGQKVYESPTSNFDWSRIDVSHLSSGMYLAKIKTSQAASVKTIKFMKE